MGGCGSAGPARCLIHDPDDVMGQAADDAYPALADLRAQGVVRAIGAGMNAAAPLAWLIERCDLDCVLVAGRYTLLDDSAADSRLAWFRANDQAQRQSVGGIGGARQLPGAEPRMEGGR